MVHILILALENCEPHMQEGSVRTSDRQPGARSRNQILHQNARGISPWLVDDLNSCVDAVITANLEEVHNIKQMCLCEDIRIDCVVNECIDTG